MHYGGSSDQPALGRGAGHGGGDHALDGGGTSAGCSSMPGAVDSNNLAMTSIAFSSIIRLPPSKASGSTLGIAHHDQPIALGELRLLGGDDLLAFALARGSAGSVVSALQKL